MFTDAKKLIYFIHVGVAVQISSLHKNSLATSTNVVTVTPKRDSLFCIFSL